MSSLADIWNSVSSIPGFLWNLDLPNDAWLLMGAFLLVCLMFIGAALAGEVRR